jgi:hypothetical protein
LLEPAEGKGRAAGSGSAGRQPNQDTSKRPNTATRPQPLQVNGVRKQFIACGALGPGKPYYLKPVPGQRSRINFVGSFVEISSFRAIPVDKAVSDKASDKGENRLSGTSLSGMRLPESIREHHPALAKNLFVTLA